jgi:hypothetical protein
MSPDALILLLGSEKIRTAISWGFQKGSRATCGGRQWVPIRQLLID